jgi:glycosyl hydrolase group 75 (putative chitosanase)
MKPYLTPLSALSILLLLASLGGCSTSGLNSNDTSQEPARIEDALPEPKERNSISVKPIISESTSLSRADDFQHRELGAIPIYQLNGSPTNAVLFESQMTVNADGAPDAYHPEDIGTSYICSGLDVCEKGRCRWENSCMAAFRQARDERFRNEGDRDTARLRIYGFVTDNGTPRIQGNKDPKPGYYISTTALKQPGVSAKTVNAQLDSNTINFIVIPRAWRNSDLGIGLGDIARVCRKSTEQCAYAVIADIGPNNALGEGSIALHRALNNEPLVTTRPSVKRARRGIAGRDVVYLIFPGSRTGKRITPDSIQQEGQAAFEKLGQPDVLTLLSGARD